MPAIRRHPALLLVALGIATLGILQAVADEPAPWSSIDAGAPTQLHATESTSTTLISTLGQPEEAMLTEGDVEFFPGFLQEFPFIVTPATRQASEDQGTVGLPVLLTAPADVPIHVNYAFVPGTATPGTDYIPTTGTLTFLPGEYSATVPVSIGFDCVSEGEGDQNFVMVLSDPVGAPIIGSNQQTVQIRDSTPKASSSIPGTKSTSGIIPVTALYSTGNCQPVDLELQFKHADPSTYPWTSATLAWEQDNPMHVEEGCGLQIMYWDSAEDIPTSSTEFLLRVVASLPCGNSSIIAISNPNPGNGKSVGDPMKLPDIADKVLNTQGGQTNLTDCGDSSIVGYVAAVTPTPHPLGAPIDAHTFRSKYLMGGSSGPMIKEEVAESGQYRTTYIDGDGSYHASTVRARFQLNLAGKGLSGRPVELLGALFASMYSFEDAGEGKTSGTIILDDNGLAVDSNLFNKYYASGMFLVGVLTGTSLYDNVDYFAGYAEAEYQGGASSSQEVSVIGRLSEALISSRQASDPLPDPRRIDTTHNRQITATQLGNKFVGNTVVMVLDHKKAGSESSTAGNQFYVNPDLYDPQSAPKGKELRGGFTKQAYVEKNVATAIGGSSREINADRVLIAESKVSLDARPDSPISASGFHVTGSADALTLTNPYWGNYLLEPVFVGGKWEYAVVDIESVWVNYTNTLLIRDQAVSPGLGTGNSLHNYNPVNRAAEHYQVPALQDVATAVTSGHVLVGDTSGSSALPETTSSTLHLDIPLRLAPYSSASGESDRPAVSKELPTARKVGLVSYVDNTNALEVTVAAAVTEGTEPSALKGMTALWLPLQFDESGFIPEPDLYDEAPVPTIAANLELGASAYTLKVSHSPTKMRFRRLPWGDDNLGETQWQDHTWPPANLQLAVSNSQVTALSSIDGSQHQLGQLIEFELSWHELGNPANALIERIILRASIR